MKEELTFIQRQIKDQLCEVSPTPITGSLYNWLPKPGFQALVETPEISSSRPSKKIHIGGAQWVIPECLWRPEYATMMSSFLDEPEPIPSGLPGLSQIIFDEILGTSEYDPSSQTLMKDLVPKIFSNIVVCGGASKFKGLKTRLKNGLFKMYSEQIAPYRYAGFYDFCGRFNEKNCLLSKIPKDIQKVTETYYQPFLEIKILVDSDVGAWKGASMYSKLPEFLETGDTLEQYNETHPSFEFLISRQSMQT